MQILTGKRSYKILIGLVVVAFLALANLITLEESAVCATQKSNIVQSKFRWHRSVRISSGNGQEAIQFAKEVSEYVNKKYPEIFAYAYTEVFGAEGTLHFF